jgi:hypothetical protein
MAKSQRPVVMDKLSSSDGLTGVWVGDQKVSLNLRLNTKLHRKDRRYLLIYNYVVWNFSIIHLSF